MSAVSRVAIVGSGVAGTAAAILLAEGGVDVDVFERKPDLSALGSGITLQGNALRVFDRLGVWEQVKEAGYAFDVTGLRAPGPDAPVIARDPGRALTGGPEHRRSRMYRPDLAHPRRQRVRSSAPGSTTATVTSLPRTTTAST